MKTKNIYSKFLIALAVVLPVTAFGQIMLPSTAFAQAVATGGDFGAYVAANWIDIPFILLVCIAAYFAVRSAFLYGGVIGEALKILSVGIFLLAAEEILGFVLLDEVAFNNSFWVYIADVVQFIGAIMIAFALFRLYSGTKKQLGTSTKK